MTARACRFGILSTANIGRKNYKAIGLSGAATVTAVASREPQRAAQFIAECQAVAPLPQAPAALGSYEELLARDDVDAVYIPLPTGIRKEWVLRAAAAGKHVLCEKPCAVQADDLAEMLAACKQHRVQFMDGVMFMHSARLPKLRETLSDPSSLGEMRRIATQFSFAAPPEFFQENIRASAALEPFGCLGDLGWYNIRFILWALQYELPARVSGRLHNSHGREQVPLEFSGELLFSGNVSAGFYCSFLTQHQQWAHVSGSRGHVLVEDFVLPGYGCEAAFKLTNASYAAYGCDFNMEIHSQRVAVPEYSNGRPNSQEVNMIRTFSQLALSGHPDPAWGEIALATQRVLDAALASAKNDGRPVELRI